MGRPRKNRVGEYAQLFAEELQRQVAMEVTRVVEEGQDEYRREIASLRSDIQALTRQMELLNKKAKLPKPKVGKWVPGGPGRPPKDASDRIAAFEARTQKTGGKKKSR